MSINTIKYDKGKTTKPKTDQTEELKKYTEQKTVTIVVHSGGFDKLMSAFVIGNGYLAIGYGCTLYFTFWGLRALKKNGFSKAPLSRMNFFGLGKYMIKNKMKKYNVRSLENLAESYKELGGKIIACTMTMEAMGITKEDIRSDLIDQYGTVGSYVYASKDAQATLFI
jgi:peroxiredoxin family protein